MGEIQILLEQEKVSSLVPGMGIGNMGPSELGSKSLKTWKSTRSELINTAIECNWS